LGTIVGYILGTSRDKASDEEKKTDNEKPKDEKPKPALVVAPLATTECASCKATNEPGAVFCNRCGVKLGHMVSTNAVVKAPDLPSASQV
jgi:hypothetical protein